MEDFGYNTTVGLLVERHGRFGGLNSIHAYGFILVRSLSSVPRFEFRGELLYIVTWMGWVGQF